MKKIIKSIVNIIFTLSIIVSVIDIYGLIISYFKYNYSLDLLMKIGGVLTIQNISFHINFFRTIIFIILAISTYFIGKKLKNLN